ncbi:MAG: GGDEF domain-containing protein [Cellvibrionaceae bacterium]
MAHNDDRWRDKYRASLSQQEQLEKTLGAQQALLHRTVIALSTTAEGRDSEVDKRLAAIRASLKSNDVGGFDRMLKSLERVNEEADKRKEKQWNAVSKNLGDIAGQLQKSSPSSEIKGAVKQYKKCIPKGELLPATLKRLLEELSKLQVQALEERPGGKSEGLMGRIFGKGGNSDDDSQADNVDTQTNAQTDNDWEIVDENDTDIIIPELVDENDAPITNTIAGAEPLHRQRNIPEAVHERPVHEPAFSRISNRVTIILTELLDHFPVVPCVEQKAHKARERITKGLNWYELAPTLEDIRDFVIQSYMGADDNYRLYLKNVYQELSHITEALGLAIESEERQRNTSDALHLSVSNGMSSINKTLAEHHDIDHLKTAVQAQVQSIQGALSQSKETQKEEDDSLSSQLNALIERVQRMEKQDIDIRKQLEQEKARAITDSLTGLPNREAYSERVHDELLRWQRYQHPLCLAVLDIDFFKKINDNYGHQTGDKVLKAVSTSVANRLREVDFMARFGGEEFVILLPETSADNALTMLNRTRERLAKTQMRSKGADGQETKFTVTVSIGIAEFSDGDTAENVFERADKALYDAKEGGRNQCLLG